MCTERLVYVSLPPSAEFAGSLRHTHTHTTVYMNSYIRLDFIEHVSYGSFQNRNLRRLCRRAKRSRGHTFHAFSPFAGVVFFLYCIMYILLTVSVCMWISHWVWIVYVLFALCFSSMTFSHYLGIWQENHRVLSKQFLQFGRSDCYPWNSNREPTYEKHFEHSEPSYCEWRGQLMKTDMFSAPLTRSMSIHCRYLAE